MKLKIEPITLDLKTTFRIAHGADDQRFNVFVHLDEGVGEAPAVPYYGETREIIVAYLKTVPDLGSDPFDIDGVLSRLPPGSRAGRAAVDIALHDLWGKRLGQPLYRLFGLNPLIIPQTSFTIAMDRPEEMARQAAESGYPILKVKLGASESAQDIVAAIRAATSARLRVDANAGWTREQALELIPRMAEYQVEFVEQPLAADDFEGYFWLKKKLLAQKVHVPIFADESIKTARDIIHLAGSIDGVVVKLMKTEGLRGGLRAIHTARAHDMQIMLSCMVESSVGVTAAAHLAPLCDFVDLDGPLLIKNDPYRGIRYAGATVYLPDLPGIGLERVDPFSG
jgi:L-alanine-DL-glutamate epimerase-like enolase superfamily enzyme